MAKKNKSYLDTEDLKRLIELTNSEEEEPLNYYNSLMEDSITPDPLEFRMAVALKESGNVLPPEPTSLTDAFLHGASFGQFGEEPDTTGGAFASFIGDATMFIIASAIGGLGLGAAGLRATTTLGRVASEGVIGSAIGLTGSAITPEEDVELIPIYGLGGAAAPLIAKGIGSLFKTSPMLKNRLTGKTAIEGTGEDVVASIDNSLANSGIVEGVSTIVKQSEQLDTIGIVIPESLGDRAIKQAKELYHKYIDRERQLEVLEQPIREEAAFGKLGQSFFHKEAKQAARVAIRDILETPEELGGFSGRLHTAELDFIQTVLSEATPLVDKRLVQEEINVLSKAGRLSITTPTEEYNMGVFTAENLSPRIRPSIAKKLEPISNELRQYNIKAALGLKPEATENQVLREIKRAKDTEDTISEMWTKDPELNSLRTQYDEVLDTIRTNIHTVTPSMKETIEFQDFIRSISEFGSRTNQELIASRTLETIRLADQNSQKLMRSMSNEVSKVFGSVSKPADEEINSALKKALGGKKITHKDIDQSKSKILQYLLNEISKHTPEEINPQASSRLKELHQLQSSALDAASREALTSESKQISQQLSIQVLSNPAIAEQVLNLSGNRLLQQIYYTYKASIGDPHADDILKFLLRENRSNVRKDIVTGQLLANPGEGITSTGIRGGATSEVKGTFADVVEEIDAFTKDISTWDRYLAPPLRTFERLIGKAKTNKAKALAESSYLWIRDMIDAHGLVRRLHLDPLDGIKAKLNDLEGYIKGLEPEMSKATVTFINNIAHQVNKQISDSEFDDVVVNAFINNSLSKQPAAVAEGWKKYQDITTWIFNLDRKTIEAYNSKIELGQLMGKPIPMYSQRPGYVPFYYEGDYIVRVLDTSSKQIGIDIVTGRKGAYASIRNIIKEQEKLGNIRGTIVVEPRIITQSDDFDIMASMLGDINTIFGREASQIKKLLDTGKFRSNNLNDIFFGNLLPRTANLENRRLDVFRALELRAAASARLHAYLEPTTRGKQIAKSLENAGAERASNYIRELADDALGRSRDFEKVLDSIIRGGVSHLFKSPTLAKTLAHQGITPTSRVTRQFVHALTFMSRTAALGLNLGTAILNPIIYLTNVTPVIGFRAAKYGLEHISDAMKMSTTSPYINLFRKANIDLFTTGLGMREAILTSSFTGSHLRRFAAAADNKSMWLFNESEKITRGVTLLGARKQAEQMSHHILAGHRSGSWQEKLLVDIKRQLNKKIDDVDVLDEYAIRIMEKTNFVYDTTNLPALMRNPALKPFLQFKSFFVNQLEFIFGLSKSSKTDLFKSLGMLAGIGGIMGLPGINELDALSRTFLGWSPKEWFNNSLPEAVSMGIPAFFGVDMSSRVNYGDLTYLFDTDNIFGSYMGRVKKSLQASHRGHEAVGVRYLEPTAMRNLIDSWNLLINEEIRDPYSGQTVLKRGDVNPLSFVMRAAGFPTPQESQRRLHRMAADALLKDYKASYNKGMAQITEALYKGNKEKATKLQRRYGITTQQVKARQQRIKMTQEQLIRAKLPQNLEQEFNFDYIE